MLFFTWATACLSSWSSGYTLLSSSIDSHMWHLKISDIWTHAIDIDYKYWSCSLPISNIGLPSWIVYEKHNKRLYSLTDSDLGSLATHVTYMYFSSAVKAQTDLQNIVCQLQLLLHQYDQLYIPLCLFILLIIEDISSNNLSNSDRISMFIISGIVIKHTYSKNGHPHNSILCPMSTWSSLSQF